MTLPTEKSFPIVRGRLQIDTIRGGRLLDKEKVLVTDAIKEATAAILDLRASIQITFTPDPCCWSCQKWGDMYMCPYARKGYEQCENMYCSDYLRT